MTASALVRLGGVAYTLTRSEPDAATGLQVTEARPVPTLRTASGPPVLTVLGDSFTDDDPACAGPNGWPAQVAGSVGLEVVNLAHGGAGYISVGSDGYTFPREAAEVTDAAAVVVVFGGYNDRALSLDDVAAAARTTVATVQDRAPGAGLVIVGPQWPGATPPPALLAIRDSVHAIATEAGAVWVDPIAGRWFADRPELISADGIHPTKPAGQEFLASRLAPYVRAALAR